MVRYFYFISEIFNILIILTSFQIFYFSGKEISCYSQMVDPIWYIFQIYSSAENFKAPIYRPPPQNSSP